MEKYEVLRIAGRGAYGTAYLARRKTDGREVILKQVPIEQLNSADRQSILTEIKVLSMLHHPNVIEYIENFLQDKAMMIVMEFAAGGTLFDLVEMRRKEGKYLDEAELVHLFGQIVLSMYYVHQNQILHRDLKTQNIFLTRSQDHVKIGDFGISKILSTKSKAFTVVGTPCYISPELCEGKPYNTKSDVWALGCVLYELCALKRAFEAPTLPALIMKIMRGVISPIPGQYSAGARQLLSSLLSVEPTKRPSLAEIMSHHWVAPAIFRLPTTVGLIACTARHRQPPALLTPEDVIRQNSRLTSRRGSPAAFSGEETRASWRWEPGGAITRLVALDPRSELVDLGLSDFQLAAVESSGKVVTWEEGGNTRHCSGLSGISIVRVAVGGGFLCLLTDRGILLTKGEGKYGCLGQGDTRDLAQPKIVEALLGDDIAELSVSERHVAALTGDGEVFTWGEDNGTGCLGQGRLSSVLQTRPELVETEEDVETVVCGREATAVIAPDGRLAVTGSNSHNRLGLDSLSHIVEKINVMTPVAGLGPVLTVSLGTSCSLVVTRSGEMLRLGGEARAVTKIDLGLDNVALVAALPTMGALLTRDGEFYSFNYKKCNKTKLTFDEERNKQKQPLKLIKNNQGSSCILHFQLT